MLWLRPYTWVNRNGSAAIASTGVKVNTADVVFTFKNHAFVNANYRGTIFVNLRQAIPTGTTGTLPILFETNYERNTKFIQAFTSSVMESSSKFTISSKFNFNNLFLVVGKTGP